MTSYMALDGVISFLRFKDVTNTGERMRHSQFTSSLVRAIRFGHRAHSPEVTLVLVIYSEPHPSGTCKAKLFRFTLR